MKNYKQKYIKVLRQMDTEFILNSLHNPSPAMRDIHLALHRIVLRERRVLTCVKLK